MQRGEYTLNDLTEIAGVSARTVRYYIAEGLLPPPQSVGSRATYVQAHLDRLLLIGRLKEAFLPLREIRRQLDGMTDADVSSALSSLGAQGDSDSTEEFAPAVQHEQGDASRYIRRVLESSPDDPIEYFRQRVPVEELRSAPRSPERDLNVQSDARYERHLAQRRNIDAETGEQWRRIELGPDAELLVREDAYHRNQSRIEWLINWAQRVFR